MDIYLSVSKFKNTELGTFEWWISGLMLDPLFFLIYRFSPCIQFKLDTGYTDILSDLKTFEWNILNPDRLINLEIKTKGENKHYLISRLRKRVDQALIPISTSQKFPALFS